MTHLLNLAEVLAATAEPLALAQHIARGELAAAVALARQSGAVDGLESLPAWQETVNNDPAWAADVVQVLVPKTAVRPTSSAGQTFITPLGGLFWLLPIMLDLRLPELLNTLTVQDTEKTGEISAHPRSSASNFLYWLALKCLGGMRAAEWRSDAALLLALA
ncbi:MAG: hypothetical protein H6661_02620 [Ardenticatenaceae bacterium]|nr:hypothetical protein [Ardenticatenaceae bacterium]